MGLLRRFLGRNPVPPPEQPPAVSNSTAGVTVYVGTPERPTPLLTVQGKRDSPLSRLVHELRITSTQAIPLCDRAMPIDLGEVARKVATPENACPRCFPGFSKRGWR